MIPKYDFRWFWENKADELLGISAKALDGGGAHGGSAHGGGDPNGIGSVTACPLGGESYAHETTMTDTSADGDESVCSQSVIHYSGA